MRATGMPVPVRGRGAPGVGRAAARARPSARLDSGLSAADFALEREVGSLSVDTTVEVASLNEGGDALSGLSLTRGLETSREDGVVRVFAARLEVRQRASPRQRGALRRALATRGWRLWRQVTTFAAGCEGARGCTAAPPGETRH